MIPPEPRRPRSRPRALCLDLSGTELLPVPPPSPNSLVFSQDTPATFGGHLLRLAANTGLPTVVLSTEHASNKAVDLPEALRDQIMFPTFPVQIIQAESGLAKFDFLVTRMGIKHEDLLCISNEDQDHLRNFGLRSHNFEDAEEYLASQLVYVRAGMMSGSFPMKDETVHTAIVPLDVEFEGEDQLLMSELGYRTFDTVLMAEVFVPLAGFPFKAVQNLVSRFAPILNVQRIDGEEPVVAFSATMKTLRQAGCRRVIFVSQDGTTNLSEAKRFEAIAKSTGFDVEVLSWKHLIKAGGAVGYA